MVSDALHIESDVIQCKRDALDHVVGVLVQVLKELLDVDISALEQVSIVDVHHDGIKIVVFFLLQRQIRGQVKLFLTHSR